jgi:integrase
MKNGSSVKVADLLALVQRDYRDKKKRSLYTVNLYINNQLVPYFGDRVANFVLESHIDEYKDQRKEEKASEVTINRELAVLKRAFNLGKRRRLIKNMPYIELYPEPEPREGHYEYEEFIKFQETARAICARKNFDGVVVADVVMFAYFSGWRLNECLRLNKDWIKVKERIVVLPASKHRNRKLKTLSVGGENLGDDTGIF